MTKHNLQHANFYLENTAWGCQSFVTSYREKGWGYKYEAGGWWVKNRHPRVTSFMDGPFSCEGVTP